jgi:FKBP-type peptidyl-prolyl cis-trans isomerase 2
MEDEKTSKLKQVVKKNDFVELEFTGYANGEVFDSNIEVELKKINPEAKVRKLIVIVGEGMVVKGFDSALVGKGIGKDYSVEVKAVDGFGPRKSELVKIIPLKVFHEQKIEPRAGAMLSLDGAIVKVITVSGARVVTDFNNPLAGKDLEYKFKIVKKVIEEKEKIEAVFEFFMKFKPDFEVKESWVVLKGPKALEGVVKAFGDKFKELLGKELKFEEVKKKTGKVEDENSEKATH